MSAETLNGRCPTCGQRVGHVTFRVGDGWLWVEGTPAKILSILETDGGWVSTLMLVDSIPKADSTIRHALGRLRRKGLVEAKPAHTRYEPWLWRAVPQ